MSKKELREMARRKEQSGDKQEDTIRRIRWHCLTRNQKEVAEKVIDGNYRFLKVAGWGFLDKFIIFLDEIGFLKTLDIDGKGYDRKLITIAKLLMTYEVKVLLGIKSMNQVPEMLFGDIGLMMLIGFTAEQLKNGHCKRGKGKANKPMHKDTLGDMLGRFAPAEMEKILNDGVKILAKKGFIEDTDYIIDDSPLETTEKCEGCGKKTVMEKQMTKENGLVEIPVTTYGFKLLAIRGVKSRQIVAAKIIKINDDARKHVLELIEQARKNIGKDKIKLLLIDRGFIDGVILWELKHKLGIDFIVPLKTDMRITSNARGLRNTEIENKIYRDENKNLSVVGIKGLTSYDQYGDEEHNQKDKFSKDFRGNKINVVMVTKWDGKEYAPGKEKVFLTSLQINRPLQIIDKYDKRSLIENTTFRELKQGWLINKVPKKTRRGVTSHAILTLCMYNMTNAYRTGLGEILAEKGVRRWRIQTYSETRNKIVIIAGDYYGIFDIEELMILAGKPPGGFLTTNPDKFRKDYDLIREKE
ncbi:transposase [bacterium]|nr:transposase [bacterium]